MRITAFLAVLFLSALGLVHAADARSAIKKPINIEAQGLASALQKLAKQCDVQIVYRSEVASAHRTDGVQGDLTLEEALRELLSETGLTFDYLRSDAITIRPIVDRYDPDSGSGRAKPFAGPTGSAEGERLARAAGNAPSPAESAPMALTAQGEPAGGAPVRGGNNGPGDAKDTNGPLEEIVVTAERRSKSLQKAPVAVSAFTRESLEVSLVRAVEDLGKAVPNLKFLMISGSRSTLQVSLRGGSEQVGGLVTSESPVAFYLDDVYVGRLAGANVELADVDRLEVLRGPQGTLYGRNAFSGALKVITRTPGPDEWLSSSASVGAFNEKILGISKGATISEGLGASLSAYWRERDGFIENIALQRDVYAERNLAVRGKLHWFQSDSVQATLSLSAVRDRNDGAANQIPIEATRPLADAGPVNPGVYATSDDLVPLVGRYASQSPFPPNGATDQDVAALDLRGSFGALGWRSISAYIGTDDRFAFELSGGRRTPEGQFYISSLGRVSEASTKQHSQELQLYNEDPDAAFEWISGLYYLKEDSRQTLDDVLGLAPNFLLSVLPQTIETETQSYAAYGQGKYKFTDRIAGTVGVRYSRDDKELDGAIQNRLPFGPGPDIGLVSVARTASFESWTPRIAAEFQVNDDVFAYLSYSRGFKAGGFNGLAVANPEVFSTVFAPQKVAAYEAGLKATVLDGRLRSNVSVFQNDLTALQQTIEIGTGSFATRNVGDTRVRGVELELTAAPADGWTVFLSGGAMDDQYRRLSPLSEAAVNGARRLPLLSKWNYRVGFNYESSPLTAAQWRLSFGADYSEVDDYFTVVNNRLLTRGYGLLDGSIRLTSRDERWTVSLLGRNLTNEFYGTGATASVIAVGVPRTWQLGVRFQQ